MDKLVLNPGDIIEIGQKMYDDLMSDEEHFAFKDDRDRYRPGSQFIVINRFFTEGRAPFYQLYDIERDKIVVYDWLYVECLTLIQRNE